MTGHATAIDLEGLAKWIRGRIAPSAGRLIVAIAGAPGSGKSTVAEELVALLNAKGEATAAVLPMDGFHYDDLYLVPAGLRPRKGAPDTFDVGGFRHLLQRLRARDEPFVAVPVFDRSLEIARAGARLIPAEIPVIVTEGNYLLLEQGMWPELRPMFDLTVLIDVPESVLCARLEARWKHYGLTAEETRQKLEENDLPNGRLIMASSATPDFVLPNG
jgi:pantothenate kinase